MWDKFKNEITLGALLIVFFVILAYLSIKIGGVHTVINPKHIKGIFEHASGVVKDASVMVAGVPVGSVKKLVVFDDKALLLMDVSGNVGIRKDARAEIRAKSLLGEKYVEIIPQSDTAPPIQNGDVITDTSIPFELDQMVTALAPLLKQLGQEEIKGMAEAFNNLTAGINRVANQLKKKSTAEQEQIVDSVVQSIQDLPVLISNLNTFTKKGIILSSKVENISRDDIVELMRKEGILVRMKEQ
jgi:phospholipid/cholesterol/gamma-HCH transport system substrate-binding protein